MIATKSLVVYKSRPALVLETGEKIRLSLPGNEQVRVREKDIELIHPGPCSLAELEENLPEANVRETWELLEGSIVPLKELAELAYGEYSAGSAWAAYSILKEGLYFSGDIGAVNARSAEKVEAGEKKREEKQREQTERAAFIERLKSGEFAEKSGPVPEANQGFFQDVEALAYGRTDKSRTLRDLEKSETPEEAHRLLLATKYWSPFVNPYPLRFNVSTVSAQIRVNPPPQDEERLDLTRLRSYAIDNAWSKDPDDAVSIEKSADGRTCLYVHVADPAASIRPGSPADLEARGRGATLYLPEGVAIMIADLDIFALGLREVSPALSFKLLLNKDFSIAETEIIRSWVNVTRLTYEQADALRAGPADPAPATDIAADMRELFDLAKAVLERRLDAGAVDIDLPEVHIAVSEDTVLIEPLAAHDSAIMVRECMLLAGTGAARWALQRRLPFPYISQEAGDIPNEILPGMAGSYQLRRCMRPRSLSVKPGIHWGLGLDEYTQVTSPLRRYTDLLAHQQIRAFLRNEEPLSEEEVLLRLAASEAAASATVRAERASRAHWTAVYLLDKNGSQWEAVALEKKGSRTVVMIPALGLETQVSLRKDPEPNGKLTLSLSSVRLPEAQILFTSV